MPSVAGSTGRTGRPGGRDETVARAHVLVVDDDENSRTALELVLRAEGFATTAAPDGGAALREVARALPDLVLTDLHMPVMGGAELCRRIHQTHPDLPVIVVTGFGEMETVIESLRAGAEDYMVKPLNYDVVLWSLGRALARRRAKAEEDRRTRHDADLYRILNERLVLSSVREQEHAEAETWQRTQLNALLEHLAEGVIIAEPTGRVVMINDTARGILGIQDDGPRSIDDLDALEANDLRGRPLRREERPLRRAVRGERFSDYEVVRVRPDGERRRIMSTGTNVKAEDGSVTLAIVVFRDVTDLRRLEQQRDEFLALVSHDLRNPLSNILMSNTVLKRFFRDGEAALLEHDPAIPSFLERIDRNAKRMNRMIADLTEATGLESRGVELRRERCDLRAMVARVVDDMDVTVARRVTVDAEDAAPYFVFADAHRLERAVVNLLTNALKYSDEDAPVQLRLAREGSEIGLAVTDHGIGISPESLKMLFTRYYRTDSGKARAGGLGLGLYITRLFVEASGGRIDVASKEGEGSTFRLTLPAHVC